MTPEIEIKSLLNKATKIAYDSNLGIQWLNLLKGESEVTYSKLISSHKTSKKRTDYHREYKRNWRAERGEGVDFYVKDGKKVVKKLKKDKLITSCDNIPISTKRIDKEKITKECLQYLPVLTGSYTRKYTSAEIINAVEKIKKLSKKDVIPLNEDVYKNFLELHNIALENDYILII